MSISFHRIWCENVLNDVKQTISWSICVQRLTHIDVCWTRQIITWDILDILNGLVLLFAVSWQAVSPLSFPQFGHFPCLHPHPSSLWMLFLSSPWFFASSNVTSHLFYPSTDYSRLVFRALRPVLPDRETPAGRVDRIRGKSAAVLPTY